MRKRGSGLIGEVRKRPEFMGYAVSIPQYLRLESLQKATIGNVQLCFISLFVS